MGYKYENMGDLDYRYLLAVAAIFLSIMFILTWCRSSDEPPATHEEPASAPTDLQ